MVLLLSLCRHPYEGCIGYVAIWKALTIIIMHDSFGIALVKLLHLAYNQALTSGSAGYRVNSYLL